MKVWRLCDGCVQVGRKIDGFLFLLAEIHTPWKRKKKQKQKLCNGREFLVVYRGTIRHPARRCGCCGVYFAYSVNLLSRMTQTGLPQLLVSLTYISVCPRHPTLAPPLPSPPHPNHPTPATPLFDLGATYCALSGDGSDTTHAADTGFHTARPAGALHLLVAPCWVETPRRSAM